MVQSFNNQEWPDVEEERLELGLELHAVSSVEAQGGVVWRELAEGGR